MFRVRSLLTLACALAVGVLAGSPAWSASEALRPFERIGHVPSATSSAALRVAAPAHVSGITTVVVDDSWSALVNGTTVTVGGSYTIGTDAFSSIQAGIDAVDAGGTVKVLPGDYSETAAGRNPVGVAGTYQFGLFSPISKPGLTIEGVDASGTPIATYATVLAHVVTNASNDFGPDGVWVEGDGVTISGLDFGTNYNPDPAGYMANKTISVSGDAFTFRACTISDPGGALYMDDVRYDAINNVSHMKAYRIEGDYFELGVMISIQNGAGYSGPVSGRVITGSRFDLGASDYWPGISFNGSGTGVGWFVYSVGGALITNNTFVNAYPQGQQIRTRGTVPTAQFEWSAYWSSNTFDRKVAVGSGPAPLANLTPYAYSLFSNCRRIGAGVQGEVDHANAGDVVLVGGGTYTEQVVVDGKSVTIQGAGRASTTVQSPATLAIPYPTKQPVIAAMNAADIEITNLTVDGLGAGNANIYLLGIGYYNAGGKVLDCNVTRIRDTPFSGAQHGVAIYATNTDGGPYALEVGRCNVTDWQKGGMSLNEAGLTVNVHDCTVTANGPTGVTAQNGIQLYGSSGSITNCTVTGNYWTGTYWVACGMLLYGPSTVNISGCTLGENQYSVYAMDVTGTLNGTSISNTVVLFRF